MKQRGIKNKPEEDWVSKSQLKREAQDLKDLSVEIMKLTPAQMATVPLSDEMVEAIALAGRIANKREALRRHLNYIGKVMRNEELEGIEVAMEKIRNRHLYENQRLHQLEQLRDNLLSAVDTDAMIDALMAKHEKLDRQKLRQLVRQAKKEAELKKPPKSSREIFKYFKESISGEL
jgi:ribosome-associated protein